MRIKLPLIIFLSFLLIGFNTNAQKEGNIWYFGREIGIDFNSGSPVIIDGKLSTAEGCATVCDENGSLLFYTDGITVFNKNHMAMLNGQNLTSNSTVSQAAMIVQKPGSKSNYYVFVVSLFQGFHFSEIDMTRNAGLGEVISKNQLITSPFINEKQTAIRHKNGCDFWIVVQTPKTNNFQCYLLSANGLSQTPVISNGIPDNAWGNFGRIGILKANKDGNILATTRPGNEGFSIFDFDNATGNVTNGKLISTLSYHGIEFSPNGRFIYASGQRNGFNSSDLDQYDINAGNAADILSSKITIGTPRREGVLELGPDGKIYVTIWNRSTMSTINEPDLKGIACSYNEAIINLTSPTKSSYALGGLQNLHNAIFVKKPSSTITSSPANICENDSVIFNSTSTQTFDSLTWDFGDSLSGSFNFSKNNPSGHKFSSPDSYEVSLTTYFSCHTDTATSILVVNKNPTVNLGNDTSICAGQQLTLDATTIGASYLWSDGSTNATMSISNPGKYWIKITIGGCIASDTINIKLNSISPINLGNDTNLCQGQTLILNTIIPNVNYLWQDGSTNSTFNVTTPGAYWVQISNACGNTSDSINVNFNSTPNINLGKDTILCKGQSLVLDPITSNVTYLWQDGSTNPAFNVTNPGTYWVQIDDACGKKSDTINITLYSTPKINLGNDTNLCKGQTLTLNVNTPNATYIWQEGSTSSTFKVVKEGSYWVQINNGCENISDTINIGFDSIADINLGKDTTLCKDETLVLDPITPNVTYLWQDSSSNSTFTVSNPGTYWVHISNTCGDNADSILITFDSIPNIRLGNDTTLCEGQVLTLDARSTTNAIYIWQNGSNNATLNANKVGIYWVELISFCGNNADTIVIDSDGCDCTFYIPNAFTPNFDGENDAFSPIFDCDITEYSFTIFNRWGEVLFRTNNPKNQWNGSYKGKLSPSGIYIYVVEYSQNEIRKKVHGHVNLLK